LLYDAEQLTSALAVPDSQLVEAQRKLILDPFDPTVRAEALKNGIDEGTLEAAHARLFISMSNSGSWPPLLHPEFRTLPCCSTFPSAAGDGENRRGEV
jgi:nitrate reductase beta subunit